VPLAAVAFPIFGPLSPPPLPNPVISSFSMKIKLFEQTWGEHLV
jgi:hypothetical protein